MTTPDPNRPISDRKRIAFAILLEPLLQQVADAGYGRTDLLPSGGLQFEAFPGCEDAAADLLEELVTQL